MLNQCADRRANARQSARSNQRGKPIDAGYPSSPLIDSHSSRAVLRAYFFFVVSVAFFPLWRSEGSMPATSDSSTRSGAGANSFHADVTHQAAAPGVKGHPGDRFVGPFS